MKEFRIKKVSGCAKLWVLNVATRLMRVTEAASQQTGQINYSERSLDMFTVRLKLFQDNCFVF